MIRQIKIKICGLTSLEDLKVCQELGVDMTGFIFHPASPRCVSADQVGRWPRKNELRVGVFVDFSVEQVIKVMDTAGLDLVQLHGGQDVSFCRALGRKRVIKVFWPERYGLTQDFERELARYREACTYFLFDAGRDLGGHGRRIECAWLKKAEVPLPFLLAGGLCPDNLHLAQEFGPWGVDLNSGVEISPGRKDREKIIRAVKKLRGIK